MAGKFLTYAQSKYHLGTIRPNDAAVLNGALISDYYKTPDGEFAGYSWLNMKYPNERAGILNWDYEAYGESPDSGHVSLVRAFLKSEILGSGASVAGPHVKHGKLWIDQTRAEFSKKLPTEFQEDALRAIQSGNLKTPKGMENGFATSMNDEGETVRASVWEYAAPDGNTYIIQSHVANPYGRAHTLDGEMVRKDQEVVTYAKFKEFRDIDPDDEYVYERYGIVPTPFDLNGKTEISQNPQIENFASDYDNDTLALGRSLQRTMQKDLSVDRLFIQLLNGQIDMEGFRAGLKAISQATREREGATPEDAATLTEEIKQAAARYARYVEQVPYEQLELVVTELGGDK